MFDLIRAITTTRKTYEQATAFGYLVEPIDDDAARGESEAEAAAE